MTSLATSQPSRHADPTVRATSLDYVHLERPDLERAERFLVDFGLTVVHRTGEALWLRGTEPTAFCYVVTRAPASRFVGLGLGVGSREDLERLASVPGASPVEPIEAPGGGARVRLTDPSGFAVDATFGRTAAPALPHRAPLALNTADARPRVNATQRPPIESPEVVRLGHLVLEAPAFQATCGWYTRHFGFIPSDVQVLPDGSPAVVFLRLDRGDTPSDHHTLALAQGITPELGHLAFELVDVDAVGIGGRVLGERGWVHAWGVGRHILGSQIFDYWCDPWGDKHEHYTDGDVLSADVPMGVHPVSREAMAQWGPPMPRSFTKPRLSPAKVAGLVRSLRTAPDLTVDKLRMMARIFG